MAFRKNMLFVTKVKIINILDILKFNILFNLTHNVIVFKLTLSLLNNLMFNKNKKSNNKVKIAIISVLNQYQKENVFYNRMIIIYLKPINNRITF